MKKTLKLLSVLSALIILISCCACKQNEGGILDLSYFNTAIHIETHDSAINAKTIDEIKNALLNLENRFDANKTSSLIYEFNQAPADTEFNKLSKEDAEVLHKASLAYQLTDGYYNPAIYPLVKLWDFSPYKFTANFTPPTEEQVNETVALCDFNKVQFDYSKKALKKTDNSVKLDLGGIVKGYASDLVAKILKDSGHTTGYVNIGGSSLTLLSVSSLGIRHPEKAGESILTVNVENRPNLSVSTSGDYERFYTDKNKIKYCHLINPFDGYPTKTGIRSATLIGTDGAINDAFTTALCLYQYKSNELNQFITRIIERYPDCMFFLVYDSDGVKEIYTNKKQGEDFTLQDTDYTVVNF